MPYPVAFRRSSEAARSSCRSREAGSSTLTVIIEVALDIFALSLGRGWFSTPLLAQLGRETLLALRRSLSTWDVQGNRGPPGLRGHLVLPEKLPKATSLA